jgi:hypothetical protein
MVLALSDAHKTSPHPLLDVRLWSNRGYAACAVTAVLVSASLFGTLVLLLLYFQVWSVVIAGLAIVPAAALAIIDSGRSARTASEAVQRNAQAPPDVAIT